MIEKELFLLNHPTGVKLYCTSVTQKAL